MVDISLDWNLIVTAVVACLACCWIALIFARILYLEVLSHPTVQKLARAADKLGNAPAGFLDKILKALLGDGK